MENNFYCIYIKYRGQTKWLIFCYDEPMLPRLYLTKEKAEEDTIMLNKILSIETKIVECNIVIVRDV